MSPTAQVPASTAARAGRREFALAALALALCVGAAFQPVLGAGFVNWDDPRNLLENPHFRGFSREHLAWMFTTSWMGPYQPLSWLSLALDHELWGLSGPRSFPEAGRWHLTSLVLHAGAALALFCAARRLFERLRPDADGRARLIAAWSAAALFALHPLRVESVAWVTERRDVLSGLFFALALWAWAGWVPVGIQAPARRRTGLAALLFAAAALLLVWGALDLSQPAALSLRRGGGLALTLALASWSASAISAARAVSGAGPVRRYGVCALCFALALLAKGTGMTLPVALLVLDLWPLRRVARPRAALDVLLEKVPLCALSALAARLALWGQAAQVEALVPWSGHTLVERLVQSAYGLVWYAHRTLVPSGLSAMHELPDQVALASARFGVPALVLAVALIACIAAARRAPLAAAGLCAYAVLLAPVLGLFQAGPQLVAERYSYLPGMALALGAGGVVLTLLGARARMPAALWLAPALVASLLCIPTRRLSATWHSSATLWEHALRVDPKSPAAHQLLGLARLEAVLDAPDPAAKRAVLDEARGLFERGYALGAAPRFLEYLRDAHLQSAALALDGGAQDIGRALDYSRRALAARRPAAFEMRLRHAQLCLIHERYGEAREYLAALLAEDPGRPAVWHALGVTRLGLGAPADAAPALERALQLDPGQTVSWFYLGRAREALGEPDAARTCYERVLALAPTHLGAREALARLGQ